MITMSRDLHHQDHLPLLVLITPSRFGRIILTVALPCDCLVSPLSIFPLSILVCSLSLLVISIALLVISTVLLIVSLVQLSATALRLSHHLLYVVPSVGISAFVLIPLSLLSSPTLRSIQS